MIEEDIMEEAILKAQDKLSVKQDKNSNVIEINFQHKNPVVAAKFVNTLVDFLKEKHLRIFSDPNASFLKKQVDSYKQKLHESNSKLENTRKEWLIVPCEERHLLLEHLKEMDVALKSVHRETQGQRRRLHLPQTARTNIPEYISISSISEEHHPVIMQKQFVRFRRKEQELLTKYTELVGLLYEIRNQIEMVEKFIRNRKHSQQIGSPKGKILFISKYKSKPIRQLRTSKVFPLENQEIKEQINQLQPNFPIGRA